LTMKEIICFITNSNSIIIVSCQLKHAAW